MSKILPILYAVHDRVLSEKTREKSEKVIIWIAIIGFLVHLLLIVMANFHWIQVNDTSGLLKNPIVAIYMPFFMMMKLVISLLFS